MGYRRWCLKLPLPQAGEGRGEGDQMNAQELVSLAFKLKSQAENQYPNQGLVILVGK